RDQRSRMHPRSLMSRRSPPRFVDDTETLRCDEQTLDIWFEVHESRQTSGEGNGEETRTAESGIEKVGDAHGIEGALPEVGTETCADTGSLRLDHAHRGWQHRPRQQRGRGARRFWGGRSSRASPLRTVNTICLHTRTRGAAGFVRTT